MNERSFRRGRTNYKPFVAHWLYNSHVAFRRTAHAVYDTQYHLVWAPKYRKRILQGQIRERMDALLREIAQAYRITVDEREVAVDHVHVFCSFPPSLSITQAVTCLKSLSARAVFGEYPQIKRQLWGGAFWEEGYFARTVGDDVTADVVRRYIQGHRDAPDDAQLDLF